MRVSDDPATSVQASPEARFEPYAAVLGTARRLQYQLWERSDPGRRRSGNLDSAFVPKALFGGVADPLRRGALPVIDAGSARDEGHQLAVST
jgi:hypothetical protein